MSRASRGSGGEGPTRWSLRVLVVLAVTVSLLRAPVRLEQERHRVRATLAELEAGLRTHYLGTGSYPDAGPVTAVELVEALLDSESLHHPPVNPYTNEPYGSDPFEPDRIWYSVDGEEWVLEAVSEDGAAVEVALRSSGPR